MITISVRVRIKAESMSDAFYVRTAVGDFLSTLASPVLAVEAAGFSWNEELSEPVTPPVDCGDKDEEVAKGS